MPSTDNILDHDWAEKRLETLCYSEIEDLALRLLDAKTIEDLFSR